ncbi:hypothetical protein EOPP23_12575 [Endozoicomonas sp. OPT23]|uniref:CBS domain-containing protein n=1 Tax=Endozoicomonas sp. OPT23 TaxID=2072845 RepID=UPI00129A6C5A|nr:CBS domain-containing protein [Endozoicomonas sp. OPT23]MRI33821.1 hypothetical protein [Endozoicomonas sp. OPT23]
MKTVKEVFRRNVSPLTADVQLHEAVDRILESGLTGLPVVNDKGELAGFLSEHDCIPHMITGTYHCDSRTHVSELMHKDPLFVTPETSLIDIAQMMAVNKPKVYPVIEDHRFIGVISRRDILSALSEEMKTCVSYA